MEEHRNPPKDSWGFEKEIVFEGGAAIAVSISYSNVAPQDTIKVMSGLEILSKQIAEKVQSLKEMSK